MTSRVVKLRTEGSYVVISGQCGGGGGGELHLRGSSSFCSANSLLKQGFCTQQGVPSLRSRFDFALFACEAVNGIEVGS